MIREVYCGTCKFNYTDGICSSCSMEHGNPTNYAPLPVILDSGERREFESGAVRDVQDGKGRCDLMPLDVVGIWLEKIELYEIYKYVETGNIGHLYTALREFAEHYNGDNDPETNGADLALELAQHFENGAKKYGERNWEKGLPEQCYIDSAVRHYLKYLRGDTDERHDRAFLWNIVCLIWTHEHITMKEDSNDN